MSYFPVELVGPCYSGIRAVVPATMDVLEGVEDFEGLSSEISELGNQNLRHQEEMKEQACSLAAPPTDFSMVAGDVGLRPGRRPPEHQTDFVIGAELEGVEDSRARANSEVRALQILNQSQAEAVGEQRFAMACYSATPWTDFSMVAGDMSLRPIKRPPEQQNHTQMVMQKPWDQKEAWLRYQLRQKEILSKMINIVENMQVRGRRVEKELSIQKRLHERYRFEQHIWAKQQKAIDKQLEKQLAEIENQEREQIRLEVHKKEEPQKLNTSLGAHIMPGAKRLNKFEVNALLNDSNSPLLAIHYNDTVEIVMGNGIDCVLGRCKEGIGVLGLCFHYLASDHVLGVVLWRDGQVFEQGPKWLLEEEFKTDCRVEKVMGDKCLKIMGRNYALSLKFLVFEFWVPRGNVFSYKFKCYGELQNNWLGYHSVDDLRSTLSHMSVLSRREGDWGATGYHHIQVKDIVESGFNEVLRETENHFSRACFGCSLTLKDAYQSSKLGLGKNGNDERVSGRVKKGIGTHLISYDRRIEFYWREIMRDPLTLKFLEGYLLITQNQFSKKVLDILERFKSKGCLELNVIHYFSVLRILGKAKRWSHMEIWWEFMIVSEIVPCSRVTGKNGRVVKERHWVTRMNHIVVWIAWGFRNDVWHLKNGYRSDMLGKWSCLFKKGDDGGDLACGSVEKDNVFEEVWKYVIEPLFSETILSSLHERVIGGKFRFDIAYVNVMKLKFNEVLREMGNYEAGLNYWPILRDLNNDSEVDFEESGNGEIDALKIWSRGWSVYDLNASSNVWERVEERVVNWSALLSYYWESKGMKKEEAWVVNRGKRLNTYVADSENYFNSEGRSEVGYLLNQLTIEKARGGISTIVMMVGRDKEENELYIVKMEFGFKEILVIHWYFKYGYLKCMPSLGKLMVEDNIHHNATMERGLVSTLVLNYQYATFGHMRSYNMRVYEGGSNGGKRNNYAEIEWIDMCAHMGVVDTGLSILQSKTDTHSFVSKGEPCEFMVELLTQAGHLGEYGKFVTGIAYVDVTKNIVSDSTFPHYPVCLQWVVVTIAEWYNVDTMINVTFQLYYHRLKAGTGLLKEISEVLGMDEADITGDLWRESDFWKNIFWLFSCQGSNDITHLIVLEVLLACSGSQYREASVATGGVQAWVALAQFCPSSSQVLPRVFKKGLQGHCGGGQFQKLVKGLRDEKVGNSNLIKLDVFQEVRKQSKEVDVMQMGDLNSEDRFQLPSLKTSFIYGEWFVTYAIFIPEINEKVWETMSFWGRSLSEIWGADCVKGLPRALILLEGSGLKCFVVIGAYGLLSYLLWSCYERGEQKSMMSLHDGSRGVPHSSWSQIVV